jgi:hypothetical protein
VISVGRMSWRLPGHEHDSREGLRLRQPIGLWNFERETGLEPVTSCV